MDNAQAVSRHQRGFAITRKKFSIRIDMTPMENLEYLPITSCFLQWIFQNE